MRRSDKNKLMLAAAVGLVLWFVVSRMRIHFLVSLSLTSFLVFIVLAIGVLYLLLKVIF